MLSVICLVKTLKMTQNVLWTCLRVLLRSRSPWNLEYPEKSSRSNWERQSYLVHFASYKSEDWRLHSQATIFVTNLETLVWFCPSPMLIMGITVVSVLQKYAWLNIWEGKEHIWVRTKVWRVNVRNLEKIQEKRLLFLRFVTSIVGTETYRSLP